MAVGGGVTLERSLSSNMTLLPLLREAVEQAINFLDDDTGGLVEYAVKDQRLVPVLPHVFEIGEVNLAIVAVQGIKPDVSGVAHSVVSEPKIVIVFRRIHFYSVGKTAQHPGEHGFDVSER